MESDIKILILEDIISDLELVLFELKKTKISFKHLHVENEEDFRKGLIEFNPGLILADYMLPQFTGMEALLIVRKKFPILPFIIVTGSLNETVAVECMRAGASDYVLKDNLNRLGSAIIGAIEQQKSYEAKILSEKALQDSAEFINRIIASSKDCIKVLDLTGNLLSMSKGGQKLIEIDNIESYLNKSWLNFWKEEDHKTVLKAISKASKGDSGIFSAFSPTIRGNPKWWEVIVTPIEDAEGEVDRLLAISRDITERKQAELALKEKSDQIESQNIEYIKINAELLKAKVEAEESDRLKSAFLANMSHEIRTPLNSIVGFSALLSKDVDSEKSQEFAKFIKNNSDTLLKLIDEILDMSKIEAKQLTIKKEDCEVNIVLNELYSALKIILENEKKTNIDVTLTIANCEPDFNLITDQVRFRQIINNLLDNAVKYTEDGGKIEFGYICIYDESGSKKITALQFYVKDTGIGISSDKIDSIFDRFIKIEESKTKLYRGTGIGLTITKNLVELLGGRIWVESVPGRGSDFYFTLPFETGKIIPESLKKEENKIIDWKSKTILIAEDVEESFLYISELLSYTEVNIIHAKNGIEAVDNCKKFPNIDIVLMDIKMPLMDGYEAMKIIKELKPDLPIIAQTAYAMADDKQKAIDAGAVDYLTKPISESLLFKKIINLLTTK